MADFTLFLNPRSPFARRIRLALHRLNLNFEEKDVGNVFDTQVELSNLNPLGMIPTLVTANGEAFSDSTHLFEYLHELTGNVWPKDQAARFRARQTAVWIAGIMQSAVLYFQEKAMHEPPTEYWLKEHEKSVVDTLNRLKEMNQSVWTENKQLTLSGWDLCIALEYLDIRMPDLNWRSKYESFIPILELARSDAFFAKTQPRL